MACGRPRGGAGKGAAAPIRHELAWGEELPLATAEEAAGAPAPGKPTDDEDLPDFGGQPPSPTKIPECPHFVTNLFAETVKEQRALHIRQRP